MINDILKSERNYFFLSTFMISNLKLNSSFDHQIFSFNLFEQKVLTSVKPLTTISKVERKKRGESTYPSPGSPVDSAAVKTIYPQEID